MSFVVRSLLALPEFAIVIGWAAPPLMEYLIVLVLVTFPNVFKKGLPASSKRKAGPVVAGRPVVVHAVLFIV